MPVSDGESASTTVKGGTSGRKSGNFSMPFERAIVGKNAPKVDQVLHKNQWVFLLVY